MDNSEIFSSTNRDIRSSSGYYHNQSPRNAPNKKRKRKQKKHTVLKIVVFLLCFLIIFSAGFYAYAYKMIDKVKRTSLDKNNLGITTDNFSDVKNIALLGLDTREDNNVGRSDAILILTVDKKHNKLKLTSIARDTYVAIEGNGNDKLTHAYAFGRAQLAVKTLNQNFNLEITDCAIVNFHEFSRIIDYVGGATIDVDDAEMKEMNTNIIPWMGEMGIECKMIEHTGVQLLTGSQAVCYARIRHTDSDIQRGNRQKEVLSAMFSQVKKMNILKLPKLAEMIVNECETSMSTNDIMSMGIFAVLKSPKIEQLSIPNDNVPSSGKTINGKWCYVYDLKTAEKEIKDFIFEENFYTKEAVEERQKATESKES